MGEAERGGHHGATVDHARVSKLLLEAAVVGVGGDAAKKEKSFEIRNWLRQKKFFFSFQEGVKKAAFARRGKCGNSYQMLPVLLLASASPASPFSFHFLVSLCLSTIDAE